MKKRIFPKHKHMQRVGKQTRHTHKTAAALEDVIAIQWDIINTLADTLEFARQRAENAVEALKMARKSPHSYDLDRPAGRRYEIRRR